MTHCYFLTENCPTKRALDAGDSVAFFDSFLASSFFCSRIESTPAPAPVTQTVGQPRAKQVIEIYKMTNLSQKGIILTVLLFTPLACSNLNSAATQTMEINYYSTQAMSVAQTMVSLTQTAFPSNTPEPTITKRPPMTIELYEDFEDRQFEGSTSSIKWQSLFNSRCKALQQNGNLVIADTYKRGDVSTSACDLILAMPPRYVFYDEVGTLSARMMAKKPDGENPFFYQTISFKTYGIKNRIWKVDCGIKSDRLGVHFVFNLFPADLSEQILILNWQAAKYDTWYKVKMELNAETNTIKCFIDENLFYETTPPRLSEIQSSLFFRTLSSFTGDETPYTELWFDDIYVSK